MFAYRIKKMPANRPVTKLPSGGISANMLRLIAIVLMICDHVWATVGSLGDWMTHVGRLAFPIFAFQLAEGFVHTKDRKKYALRLAVFALISEIPFNLFYSSRLFNPYHQSVMLTFLWAFAAMTVIEKCKKSRDAKTLALSAVSLLGIAAGSVITFPDYGILGVLTVVLFYVARDFPFAWLVQAIGMVLLNIVFFEGQVVMFDVCGLHFEIPLQGFAVFALIPIWLYGGKQGKRNKCIQYASYAFYPVHMVILYLIRYFA